MRVSKDLIFVGVLVVLAFAGLALRNFPFSQGDLDKNMPPLITSYDVFQNTYHTKLIFDSGQAYFIPEPWVLGLNNAMNWHPSLFYILVASFVKLTSLPIYQGFFLMVNLLSVIFILTVFVLLARVWNEKVAIIASSIALFPVQKWLFPMYIGFQYDYYSFVMLGIIIFFMICFVLWRDHEISEREWWIIGGILAVALSSIWLAHFVELLFFGPFFAVLVGVAVWRKWISVRQTVVVGCIILIILVPLVLYFYPITLQGHVSGGFLKQWKEQVNPERGKHPDYFPWPRFSSTENWFALAGLVFLGVQVLSGKLNRKQWLFLALLAWLLFVGFSNYTIGIWANRTERQLFQGYPLLVFLPALGLSVILSLFFAVVRGKQFHGLASAVLAVVVAFMFFSPTYAELGQIDGGAFVDDSKWEAFQWIWYNTPKTAKVMSLWGLHHQFDVFTERQTFVAEPGDGGEPNIESICQGKLPDVYKGSWGMRAGTGGFIMNRTGWNSFDRITFEPVGSDFVARLPDGRVHRLYSTNLSDIDYVMMQYKGSQADPCMAFYLNEMQSRNNSVVWNNDVMAIVKVRK